MVRGLVDEGDFIEVFVNTPIEECMRRDPKGLYTKAKEGKIKNFTGIDAPYEMPERPEIRLETVGHRPDELADQVVELLRRMLEAGSARLRSQPGGPRKQFVDTAGGPIGNQAEPLAYCDVGPR